MGPRGAPVAQASHSERVQSMNPQSSSDNPESSSQTVGGVGRRLGAARQARGLDLGRIAALLHLKPALVESLEQERYGDLPEPVFIAGYIRNYARHVGLDPEPLVAAYQASEAHNEPDRRWSEGSVEHNSGGGGGLLVRLVSIVLVAGLPISSSSGGRACALRAGSDHRGQRGPGPLTRRWSGDAGQHQARVPCSCAGRAPSGPAPSGAKGTDYPASHGRARRPRCRPCPRLGRSHGDGGGHARTRSRCLARI